MPFNAKDASLADWLSWQQTLNINSIELGLERVIKVAQNCSLLPIKSTVITVAGTNGKGSTVTFLDAILRSQGYKVGSYFSPHIHKYNERIRINGQMLDDETICRAFQFIEAHRDGTPLTFFEFGTLATLKCFIDADLDVVVLEVGLGGRLDAVNIVDPDVAVITNIGYDHTQWLGNDRESIAYEKMGIARADKPLVSGDADVSPAIAENSKTIGAKLYQYGEQFRYEIIDKGKDEKQWRFITDDTEMVLPAPHLFGDMQLRNASCAIMALNLLRDTLDVAPEAFAKGIESATIQGRFQRTGNGRIIYDIAHNVGSAHELKLNLRKSVKGGSLHAVFGTLKDKDVSGILKTMKDDVHRWYLSAPKSNRALRRDDLLNSAREHDLQNIQIYGNVTEAYIAAKEEMEEGDHLIVFGSVFVVAEAQACEEKLAGGPVSGPVSGNYND